MLCSKMCSKIENKEGIKIKWFKGMNLHLTSGISASLFRSSASIIKTNTYIKHMGRLQAFFDLKIWIPLVTRKPFCEVSLKLLKFYMVIKY